MTRFLSFSIVLLLAVAGCDEAPLTAHADASAHADGRASATGHVEIPIGSAGATETYSFNAVRSPNGSVRGNWTTHYRSEGYSSRAHGTIKCFTVAPDGQTAWVGGIITQFSDSNGFPAAGVLGKEAKWTVVDLGEPRTDLATELTYGFDPADGAADQHCADGSVVGNSNDLRETTRGNVHVRP
ncbi:hypothetical protein [Rubrivirga sp. IMCC45206]|uniref:hypothetical protein n=1 Tax=Rubrivirga sp. IMCC45206 TaxID=3391614 RepID=UPI00398FA811